MTQSIMKTEIQAVIQELMDRVMIRVLEKDPFLPEEHRAKKPLYAALVPDEIFKGSHFERRFVTPFGHVWENLASVAANYGFGQVSREQMITGTVKEGRLRRISEVLNQLEHKGKAKERRRPDWDSELAYILAGKGPEIPVNVICDIYVENAQTNERIAFELKAPLPNSDQTKVSKEKLLKLYAMTTPQVNNAYFALPYNPYGKKEDYEWSFPNRWFNMKQDTCVLIGNEFWERIGGVGTYQAFLEAVNEISVDYKLRIYRDYLGIEPPADFGKGL
ncbi:MAG: TdeIII family type II restriction endonuclease [Anaerolineae bacterium]|nr:TdeIII family type II restriction endonuclease [Anaerolineae bacterium]